MRCDNCPYLDYDRADDMYLCRFGFEEEDSKGRCGCKHNKKTLDKFERERLDELENEGQRMYEFFNRKEEE